MRIPALTLLLFLLSTSAGTIWAADAVTRPVVVAQRIETPPRIDGVLDDRAWTAQPIATTEWRSYKPVYGDTIPQATRVWVAYDADALYFAFQCDDPEPDRIKTSVSRRDNIGADDWVGLSLDATGRGQLSYHMMVNPNGVQLDLLNAIAGQEDSSVDWVWESAGRLTPTGYNVEIRLPLRSIRFASGDDVRMGLLFWRKVSRTGASVAWPALAPGKWVFDTNASLRIDHLDPRLPRDVIPTVSMSEHQDRLTPNSWSALSQGRDAGISAKIGLTTQTAVDMTLNPDFSQVESDAFQVDVNQRFPVFYSEKRPFFMEGAGIFSLAASGGDNSMQRAVHTRRIIDPIAGAKLTGSTGRLTFATLTAADQAPGRALAVDDPSHDRDSLVNVGRLQYSLRPGDYLGAIVADTEFAGRSNRVGGADFSVRLTPTQRVEGFALASSTHAPGTTTQQGVGATASYSYDTRTVSVGAAAEHYSQSFQMDTAFLNRVGFSSGWGYVERAFYPSQGRFGWVRRIAPFGFTQGGVDRVAGGRDLMVLAGTRIAFTRLGSLRIDRWWGYEPWAGQQFDRGNSRVQGNVQIYRWLKLDGRIESGHAVYYDPDAPFEGHRRRLNGGVVVQPNGRLAESVSVDRVTFDRRDTGAPVYAVTIVNTKTTYQFTREFLLRGIAQYDSSRHRVLTDVLASYEVRPGSVFYVGYGSLLERRAYRDQAWQLGEGTFRESQRGFFAKVSYLFRL